MMTSSFYQEGWIFSLIFVFKLYIQIFQKINSNFIWSDVTIMTISLDLVMYPSETVKNKKIKKKSKKKLIVNVHNAVIHNYGQSSSQEENACIIFSNQLLGKVAKYQDFIISSSDLIKTQCAWGNHFLHFFAQRL